MTPSPAKLIFIGTGVSTAIPVISHVLDGTFRHHCACEDAMSRPDSPNIRNNVSILVQVPSVLPESDPGTGSSVNVLVDVGKTFRDAVLRCFTKHKIRSVDALLLTHDHADAILGLDDLRDLQHHDRQTLRVSRRIPTYLSQQTLDTVTRLFPYIVDASRAEGAIARKVTQLDLHVISDDPRGDFPCIRIANTQLEITPLPVYHGGDYISLGFAFGPGGDEGCVIYLSDVNEIPQPVMERIKSSPVSVLVVDCLYRFIAPSHFSHFCWDQALEAVRVINPVRAYFVGMFCDVVHDIANEDLRGWVSSLPAEETRIKSVECAFDGLTIDISL